MKRSLKTLTHEGFEASAVAIILKIYLGRVGAVRLRWVQPKFKAAAQVPQATPSLSLKRM